MKQEVIYCRYALCGVLSVVEIKGAMQEVSTCLHIDLLRLLTCQKYMYTCIHGKKDIRYAGNFAIHR